MAGTTTLRIRVPTILLALLAAFALNLGGAAVASAAIKLGVYSAAPGKPTAMEDPRVFDRFISMVGGTPDILHDYSNVTEPLLTSTDIANLEEHGATPMVTWQLYKSGYSGSVITLPDIAAGRYDSSLREAAQLANGLPFEVLIRFAHEMNGDWYPWSPGREAGNVGSNYVDAWRHIVSVFRQEGATNVKWVWSPNVNHGQYPFAQFFPGDEWVDYVALDGYNWGTSGVGMNKWQKLSKVFEPSYSQLTKLSSKPVMIAETSASETGGDKAAWIRRGLLGEIPQLFPRVAAVVWFDRDMEQDWRVNSSNASLQAYREVVSNSLYGGTDPAPEFTQLVEEQPVRIKMLKTAPRKVKYSAGAGGARGSSVRGKVVYRLSRRARRVRFKVYRVRVAGGSQLFDAVPASRRRSGGRKAAASYIAAASVRRRTRRGRVKLAKLVAGRRLGPGVYRVVAVAIGANGKPSKPRRSHFRVVPR